MGADYMNWVQKYFETSLSEIDSAVVVEVPVFLNGISVKEKNSTLEILVYQVPLTDIVVVTVYEDGKELESDRLTYSEKDDTWIILP